VDLNELIRLIDKLEADFYSCEGGESCMKIDGHEYLADVSCAMDGVQAFSEVLKERLIEWFEEKEKKGLDKTIKLELNPMEAGYLTSLIYITMDQRPEDKAFLEKVFQRLKNESQVFYEEVD
jgi:hypothetical protein